MLTRVGCPHGAHLTCCFPLDPALKWSWQLSIREVLAVLPAMLTFFFKNIFIPLFLFLAVLSLCCCTQAFS